MTGLPVPKLEMHSFFPFIAYAVLHEDDIHCEFDRREPNVIPSGFVGMGWNVEGQNRIPGKRVRVACGQSLDVQADGALSIICPWPCILFEKNDQVLRGVHYKFLRRETQLARHPTVIGLMHGGQMQRDEHVVFKQFRENACYEPI